MNAGTPAVRPSDLAKVTSRSFYLQGFFTAERQQGLGFAFALLPIFRRLYPDDEARGRALQRHLGFFSTHPVLSGYVLGLVARLEERLAQGVDAEEDRIEQVKRAVASPLAAMGDPLFWVTLRPLAGLVGILGMLLTPLADPAGPDWRVLVCPLLSLLAYNSVALPFRFAGVPRGYASAEEPEKLLRSLRLNDLKSALERAGAFIFGALAASTLLAIAASASPLAWDLGRGALVFAPFGLGAAAAVLALRYWPGRGVEISLLSLVLVLILSAGV